MLRTRQHSPAQKSLSYPDGHAYRPQGMQGSPEAVGDAGGLGSPRLEGRARHPGRLFPNATPWPGPH